MNAPRGSVKHDRGAKCKLANGSKPGCKFFL